MQHDDAMYLVVHAWMFADWKKKAIAGARIAGFVGCCRVDA